MRRIVLDTNIFIYLANGTLAPLKIHGADIIYASVTKVEALGYGSITIREEAYIKELLGIYQQNDLTDTVINRAIGLRVEKKMSLGDAIIAATALDAQCELWTANTKDFEHIFGLQLHNPLA